MERITGGSLAFIAVGWPGVGIGVAGVGSWKREMTADGIGKKGEWSGAEARGGGKVGGGTPGDSSVWVIAKPCVASAGLRGRMDG